MSSPRSEFLGGIRTELPILIGVVPFGMIYGILALEAGLTELQTQAMSTIVFAGSAQFIMTQLFNVGTPIFIIVATAVLVNLRHALYSASIAPYTRHLPRRWRWPLAYLLTDEAYAVSITHYNQDSPLKYKHWFFLGSGLALWTTWQSSTALGILVGAQIPESWSLDFFIALSFIALVVPTLKDRADVAAALTGGVTAVLAYFLPLKLGLVAAALAGISAGVLVEKRLGNRRGHSATDTISP
jgi:4-azaleucine resistance transporter AzlC